MDEINDIGNVIANTIDNKGEDKRNFFGILRAQRGATDLYNISGDSLNLLNEAYKSNKIGADDKSNNEKGLESLGRPSNDYAKKKFEKNDSSINLTIDQYHIVWCVKYRRKVLIDDIEKTLKELLIEISNENNIKIIEMETDLDHIHILIECSPQHFIPNILKIFKGISARKLFLKHPEIKNKLWNGHLWNPSYFVATVSENTEEQIKRYIQTQKER